MRSVVEEPAVVTDQGRPMAIIQPFDAKDLPGRPLPPGHWQSQPRPHLDGNSTLAVSEDRGRFTRLSGDLLQRPAPPRRRSGILIGRH